jgi:hypothetical protein
MHAFLFEASERKSNNNVARPIRAGRLKQAHTNIHIKFRISMLVHVSSVDHKKVVPMTFCSIAFFSFSALFIESTFFFKKWNSLKFCTSKNVDDDDERPLKWQSRAHEKFNNAVRLPLHTDGPKKHSRI